MAAKLTPTALRLAALALVALLSTATITFAAGGGSPAGTAATPAPAAKPMLRVPDVRGQVFVFAKGMLADSGFAWRVSGSTNGYAVNLVETQTPAPGTQVVDNGRPTIRLTLSRNPRYAEEGEPENRAPFVGTPVVLPGLRPVTKPRPAVAPKPATKPVAKPKPAAKPRPAAKPKPAAPKPATPPAAARPPAFVVPGAPKEPLDEIPLTQRAKQLETWLASNPKKTKANVAHWLYQHEWITTGARFGWWRGAEALQTLVRVDERVIDLWGIGSLSRDVAARALREVEAKSG